MVVEQQSDAVTQRAGIPLNRFILLVVMAFLLGLLGVADGIFDVLLQLCFGWISFVWRVIPQTAVSGEAIISSLTLMALTVGLMSVLQFRRKSLSDVAEVSYNHAGAASSIGKGTWAVRVFLVTLLLFPAGMAFTGFCRNVVWVASTDSTVWHSGRETLARSRAKNQLKQLGLAMHNFHEVHSAFPAGGTFDHFGDGRHSWTTALLAHFESGDPADLGAKLRLDQPWDSPLNRRVMQQPIPELLGPNMPESTWVDDRGFAATHYSGNAWLMGPNSSLAIRDITDGTTNTLMIGQIRDQIPAWGNPVNWRDPTRRLNSPGAFGSLHVGVVQFLLADGSVRAISENVDSQVMRAISSPSGGEPVGAF